MRVLRLFGCLVMALGLAACADEADETQTPSEDTTPQTSTEPDGSAADDATEDTGAASEELLQVCVLEPGEDLDYAREIGCLEDFKMVAADPLDASIPGALSGKTVVDQLDADALYFQNTNKYQIHWEFCSAHLSGDGKPPVKLLGQFNSEEYYSPARRFLLGAVTYYEEPGVWVYEIAPYDSATADMIAKAYRLIADAAYFGPNLYFHPTSQAVEVESANLPDDVKIITTDELFAGITYQPLNLGESYGRVRFITAKELETEYIDFRDIVVLDNVPNDISVVTGIITAELQTPLSHINVLSQNRGTPNMALIGAYEDAELLALDGKWVRFEVTAFEYFIEEVSQEEADEWWEANKPDAVQIPAVDLSVTELTDCEDVLDLENLSLGEALDKAIPAFGGKASHYGGLTQMGEDVPHPKAFSIPLYYYFEHMETHGLTEVIEGYLAEEKFHGEPAYRDEKLGELRDLIRAAPLNEELLAAVTAKLMDEYPDTRMRFRSSTNAEDLDGFTGAGLYTSKSGELADPDKPIENAIRSVWASIWYFRAYEERSYRSIDHLAVGMALLVHRSFPDEEANGVALTGNIFDTTGLEPGFYINVQLGGASVVKPEAGITTDQFIYHYYYPGQPIVFLGHSNLVPEGENVLTGAQAYELGTALDAIHKYFIGLYGPPADNPLQFYGMDVEFKFDGEPGEDPALWVKQARPHPGWGL